MIKSIFKRLKCQFLSKSSPAPTPHEEISMALTATAAWPFYPGRGLGHSGDYIYRLLSDLNVLHFAARMR
jgi:hypothetical protein